MIELKPCPFCGSEDVDGGEFLPFGIPSVVPMVACDNCGCRGPFAATEEEAIEKWNDRKGEANG